MIPLYKGRPEEVVKMGSLTGYADRLLEEMKREAAEETLRGILLTVIDNGGDFNTIKSLLGIDIKQYPELWAHYQKKHAGDSGGVTKLDLGG